MYYYLMFEKPVGPLCTTWYWPVWQLDQAISPSPVWNFSKNIFLILESLSATLFSSSSLASLFLFVFVDRYAGIPYVSTLIYTGLVAIWLGTTTGFRPKLKTLLLSIFASILLSFLCQFLLWYLQNKTDLDSKD